MIRTSRFGKDAKDGTFLRYLFEDCRTLYDCFRRGAKESSKYFAINSTNYLIVQLKC